MKLFTVGPTEMYPETLLTGSKQLPYFRTEEFSDIVLECEKKLKELLDLNNGKIAFITGSGSAAMESVVSNSFDEKDNLLIINGGTFGARFVKLAQIYKIPYDEIIIKFGETLTFDNFKNLDLKKYTALLVNIDETSTGQLYDIRMLSKIAKENNMRLIVDSISSFLADDYNMNKYNIDCTIISSQKALALSPGLSFIALTNDFYEKNIKNKPIKNLYLNINEHIINMERGQTPNTPAVGIILELHERLKRINSYEGEVAKTEKLAKYFRKLAQDNGFEIPNYPLSNALTPIIIPNRQAKRVFEYLKDKYGIFVNPTGGEKADEIIRIAHIGNLKEEDYDDLIQKMKEVIK